MWGEVRSGDDSRHRYQSGSSCGGILCFGEFLEKEGGI